MGLEQRELVISIDIGATCNRRNPLRHAARPMPSPGCALKALEDLSAKIR